MMIEPKILSAFIYNRSAYDLIQATFDDSNLSDIGKILYRYIVQYYDIDNEAREIDKDIIISRIEEDFPKKKAIISNALLELHPVSVPNILEEYKNLKRKVIAEDIATRLLDNDFSENTYGLIDSLLRLNTGIDEEDDGTWRGTIYDLIDAYKPENLVKVEPSIINGVLNGGIPLGSHVVLFARPEMGKSLVSINMAAGFLREGHKVLYIGNEDPIKAMIMRFTSNLSGMTTDQVISNPEKANKIAYDNGFENLIFIGRGDTNIRLVEQKVDQHAPKIIIVDQMRNLNTGGKFSKVEALEHIAMNLRRIYKDANAIGVSITQAGDSARGKKVLDMGDVDFSNTGIPATADLMIGIGADDVLESMGQRILTFCKNKISGDHSSVAVKVLPNLNKVVNI